MADELVERCLLVDTGRLLWKDEMDGICHCPLHTLFPQRIADLVEPTRIDMQAACDLIGKDTYGKPHWTPETISPCNPVVQAFARHALLAIRSQP